MRHDSVYQAVAPILQQVEYKLETLTSFIIRIGHVAPLWVVAAELHKTV